ncbi:cupin domain-containing protein [Burkholderia multivorans]|jgi:hypothetical protein|uniref:cupin domain-containing protein n=1 Tax=Burkholderia multivorans TaxID=87883 RepID=UPI001C2320AD|nr:cupin domain-containing protein [Burkholderia multivorans]MBU9200095.1 cupin domain-containing protein [Burkholderia multivorans]MDN8078783.1 cupin domain-containing protein [Burkholderia multivorans]
MSDSAAIVFEYLDADGELGEAGLTETSADVPVVSVRSAMVGSLFVEPEDEAVPDRPELAVLGSLTPCPELLARVQDPKFALGDFNATARAPQVFQAYLAQHGYQLRAMDRDYGGLLFAHTAGVPIHTDECYSALWVLEATDAPEDRVQVIVGGQYVSLSAGDVVLFDARLPHGVISCNAERWAVLSVYIEKKPG